MKRKKKIRWLIFLILIIGTITILKAFPLEDPVKKETNEKVQRSIEYISKFTNDDNMAILDMNKDYYFLNMQDGYEYSAVKDMKYYSPVLKRNRTGKLLLPANYDENKEYKALLVLHGLHGSKNTWINKEGHIILQNVFTFENKQDVITVFVDSNLNEKENLDGLDFVESVKYFNKTEDEVINGILPHLKKNYKIKDGRENLAICGQSLGGRNATIIAYHNPSQFGYLGAFGPARLIKEYNKYFDGVFTTFKQSQKDEFDLFLLTLGKQDDVVGGTVKKLEKLLTKEGVKHIYYESEGGHNNKVWTLSLYNFLKNIFKN